MNPTRFARPWGASQALAQTKHVWAHCIFLSWMPRVFFRREDLCLVIRICQEQSQDALHSRSYFRKRMDLFEMSQKQTWIYFWLNLKFTLSYDIVTLMWMCKAIWTKKIELVLTIFKENVITFFQLLETQAITWFRLIWSLQDLLGHNTWQDGLVRGSVQTRNCHSGCPGTVQPLHWHMLQESKFNVVNPSRTRT